MHGGDQECGQRGLNGLTPVTGDAKILSKQSLCGTCSQAHHHFRLHHIQFGVEPGAARLDFRDAGLLVDAAFPTFRCCPAEMLYHVRDIDGTAIDACFGERLIKNPARRPDERPAYPVLLIARLFADQHDGGFLGALPKNRLGRISPQVASLAIFADSWSDGMVGGRDQVGDGSRVDGPF